MGYFFTCLIFLVHTSFGSGGNEAMSEMNIFLQGGLNEQTEDRNSSNTGGF